MIIIISILIWCIFGEFFAIWFDLLGNMLDKYVLKYEIYRKEQFTENQIFKIRLFIFFNIGLFTGILLQTLLWILEILT